MKSSKYKFKERDVVKHVGYNWLGVVVSVVGDKMKVCVSRKPNRCAWYFFAQFEPAFIHDVYEVF